ncbi:hypothetical protein D9M70_106450 [compost metagenome]
MWLSTALGLKAVTTPRLARISSPFSSTTPTTRSFCTSICWTLALQRTLPPWASRQRISAAGKPPVPPSNMVTPYFCSTLR